MKKNIFFIFASIVFSFNACDPDEPVVTPTPITIPECWENLVGNYIVYDTANNSTYTMSVTHKDSIEPSGNVIDSLIINNYGNKFNLRVGYICPTHPLVDLLKFPPQNPIFDHNNKKWSLYKNDDDVTTSVYENQLKNDTIILYYNINNIAYYFNDGVSYHAADYKHIAVKQH